MQSNERIITVIGPGAISSLSSQLAAANTPTSKDSANGSTLSKIADHTVNKGFPTKPPGNAPTALAAATAPATTDGQTGSIAPPYTPRRLSFSNRMALPMPSRGPLSPVLDPALGYSVARRPRLDFARSCTSLHHSTLAESSPDSSPLAISGGYPIPRVNYRPLESPISNSALAGSSHASSLGSTSMLDYAPSGDDSDSSTDEDLDGDFDLMEAVTPTNNTPNPAPTHMESAASISLRNHQKARFGARKLRRPSNNRSRTMMSPSPTMQPISHGSMMGGGFDYSMRRRDSLTLGPSALEYESDRPDPIRRPVSRRGSLLPKTKNFQRIKAELIEESSPIDVEVKREAEITRQIREEDEPHLSPQPLQGENRTMESELNSILDDQGMESGDSTSQAGNRGIGISFSKQAERHGSFWFGDQMEGININGSSPAYPGSRVGSDGDIVMNSDSSCLTSPSAIPSDMRRTKRRRVDERFEQPNVFKRRAVSPGLSNSPKLAQSPPVAGTGGKRLNFQGLSDTHDGLMKMSLQ